MSEAKRVDAVIVGAGHRAMLYASYAQQYPNRFHIVGIVEPDPERRALAASAYNVPAENCFSSVEELIKYPKIAEAAINGTMDRLHVETTLPLLEAGYHVLLEKPIGISMEEVLLLQEKAREHKRIVMICHLLRYAPFYREIKRIIAAGEIGEVTNLQMAEHVSYHHMAVSFIRGKWSNEDVCGTPMLVQKCSHDLDIMTWLMGDVKPKQTASFGSLTYFTPDHAPEGSGLRCLTDCRIEESCPYSARKLYIEQDLWGFYVWKNQFLGNQISKEDKYRILRDESPYGRCVWHCDNNVVDRQSVVVEFENGTTASHNMVGGSARPCRTLYIIGTKGEIQGVLEDGSFVVRKPKPDNESRYVEHRVVVDVQGDSHGGGDILLVEDFVRVLQGHEPSISYTSLDRSIYGHAIAFGAEASRKEGGIKKLQV